MPTAAFYRLAREYPPKQREAHEKQMSDADQQSYVALNHVLQLMNGSLSPAQYRKELEDGEAIINVPKHTTAILDLCPNITYEEEFQDATNRFEAAKERLATVNKKHQADPTEHRIKKLESARAKFDTANETYEAICEADEKYRECEWHRSLLQPENMQRVRPLYRALDHAAIVLFNSTLNHYSDLDAAIISEVIGEVTARFRNVKEKTLFALLDRSKELMLVKNTEEDARKFFYRNIEEGALACIWATECNKFRNDNYWGPNHKDAFYNRVVPKDDQDSWSVAEFVPVLAHYRSYGLKLCNLRDRVGYGAFIFILPRFPSHLFVRHYCTTSGLGEDDLSSATLFVKVFTYQGDLHLQCTTKYQSKYAKLHKSMMEFVF